MRRLFLCGWFAGLSLLYGQNAKPDFSFGVLADIQYADQDTKIGREYRQSIEKLQRCAVAMRAERPAFVIQLGDLVDLGVENLDRILPVFQQLPGPRYSVFGNHDLSLDR